MTRPLRLAVVTSHPIQYQAPLWRRLSQDPDLDVTVFFCSRQGVTEHIDPEFGVAFKWDVPLLDGYRHRFLGNLAPRWIVRGPFHVFNPGIVLELIRRSFDAVLVNGYALATYWMAIAAARAAGIPVLLRGETVLRETTPGRVSAIKRLGLRQLLRRVTVCLPIGTRSADFYRAFGVPSSRMVLAPYAVDNEFFVAEADRWRSRRADVRASLGIPAEAPVVLYAGKLTPRKRPLDLLAAFARLSSEAWLLVVGDGELLPALQARAAALHVSRVIFTGFKNQLELPAYYAASDVFVLPSGYEPWGLAVNEAMCVGLPIVTTDRVAAAVDLVKSGDNGEVLPVGDVDALAAALDRLVSDRQRRDAMGRRSAERIRRWGLAEAARGIADGVRMAVGAVPLSLQLG